MKRLIVLLFAFLFAAAPASANKLIAAGKRATVAKSAMDVMPEREWNKLNLKTGKSTETWTQDGEQLNNVTFYGGISDSQPLFRETDRKRQPLPKFRKTMLLLDVPSLLENSYRIARQTSIFTILSSEPTPLAGRNGVRFTYSFIGPDELRRNGEARAAIVEGKLYMVTYEAPTLHYFGANLADYEQLINSLRINLN